MTTTFRLARLFKPKSAIKTRLGKPPATTINTGEDAICSPEGLVVLNVVGSSPTIHPQEKILLIEKLAGFSFSIIFRKMLYNLKALRLVILRAED
jgi:hypothetical protein